MNVQNAAKAFRAAADALECGDSRSAEDYAVVAMAEISNNPKPGNALLFQTDDGHKCVQRGVIELDPNEELVINRFVYSYNHETNGCCSRKQGEGEPCRIDQSKWVEQYPPGKKFVACASGPGIGHRAYEITRHDEEGAWGVLVEDTVRELTVEEVR